MTVPSANGQPGRNGPRGSAGRPARQRPGPTSRVGLAGLIGPYGRDGGPNRDGGSNRDGGGDRAGAATRAGTAGRPGERARLERWEHGETVLLRYAPYLTLAFSVILSAAAVPLEQSGWGSFGPTVLLAALAAVWVLWLSTMHPGWIDDRRVGPLFYAGLLVFAAALVLRAPWFGFFSWIGYLYIYPALRGRWRFAGVIGTAAVCALAQIGGQLPRSVGVLVAYAVLTACNAGLAGAFGAVGWRNEMQRELREQMVADLEEANRQLGATMAENAGLHAQLVTQAREAGVLDERQRMAREIHDTLAQGLIGIVAQLEAARQAAGQPGRWQRHLDTASQLARDSLTDARRSVQALRPERLESGRLADVLADVTSRWTSINGVTAEATTTGTARPLHPEVEVALLRTAQEALSNVAKHAAANSVHLTLSYMEDQVTLDVRDDGVGFDPARPVAAVTGDGVQAGGFGLTVMRQRVQRLAGELEIESEPGAGTVVSASLPAVPPSPDPPALPPAPAGPDALAGSASTEPGEPAGPPEPASRARMAVRGDG